MLRNKNARKFKKFKSRVKNESVNEDEHTSGVVTPREQAATAEFSTSHQLLRPPTLCTSTLPAVLKFEREYTAYESQVEALREQGYSLAPVGLKSCLTQAVLASICLFELDGASPRDISDERLRKHLFTKAETLTQEQRSALAKKVARGLVMDLNGKSVEDAAIQLFEKLLEQLTESGARSILSEERQCSLIRAALRPTALAESVNDLIDTLPEWQGAQSSLRVLRTLVLQEAGYQDHIRLRKTGEAKPSMFKKQMDDGGQGVVKKDLSSGAAAADRAFPGKCYT